MATTTESFLAKEQLPQAFKYTFTCVILPGVDDSQNVLPYFPASATARTKYPVNPKNHAPMG